MLDTNTSLPDIPDLGAYETGQSEGWQEGWYAAEIVPNYETRNGITFSAQDVVSQKGDSRNISIPLKITRKDGNTITLTDRVNYRAEDFAPERLAHIIAARDENKGTQGAWADRDAQRSHLSLVRLKEIQTFNGNKLERNGDGGLDVAPLIGKTGFVRLKKDEKGFFEVKAYAHEAPKTAKVL